MTQQEFFDRYSFSVRTDKIGGGSFGTVYKAYDNTRDREVAIKVSEVREMGGKEFSLRDEFKAIGKLPVHANIAHYEDVFTFESPQGVFDYAVMQYYKEGNLNSFLESHKELSFSEREGICMAILDGIAHLHLHKVVHRDLKPGNILVVIRKNGAIVPKITDFGLSKQAGTDSKASRFTNSFAGGTLMYSSPEQIRGEKLRLNTDLWSFGAIAYEVLTGDQLFQVDGYSSASAEWQNQMTQRILKADLADKLKELPEKWRNALLQCLQREHEQRVKSTDDIKDILLGLVTIDLSADSEPTKVDPVNDDVTQVNPKTKSKEGYKPKRPTSSKTSTRPKAKKEKKWPYALALTVIAAGALGFGAWSYFDFDDAPKEEIEISMFQEEGIYGYRIGDSTIIAPKYKLADNFIDGRAKVSTNDSTYFIDPTGEWAGSFMTEDKPDIVEEATAHTDDKPADIPIKEEIIPVKENEKQDKNKRKETIKPIYVDNRLIPAKDLRKWVNTGSNLDDTKKAANNGNSVAQRRLGRINKILYENEEEAFKWYQKSTKQGDVYAQYYLAYMYDYAEGVGRDNAKAAELYAKAANQGYSKAQGELGDRYSKGHGVEKNLKEALKWYEIAASNGDSNSMITIGLWYQHGTWPLEKDLSKAIQWYEKAIANGNSRGEHRIKMLKKYSY